MANSSQEWASLRSGEAPKKVELLCGRQTLRYMQACAIPRGGIYTIRGILRMVTDSCVKLYFPQTGKKEPDEDSYPNSSHT